MSSTILTNWTVYYSGDTGGDQQIKWTGTTGTNTLRELYSELQDLFDNSAQMDDGTVMSSQTPTAYTIGLLDAGETDPWFIDPESIKHLTGGSLQTTSWKRVTGSNIGIVKIGRSGSNIVAGDIGHTITNSTGGDSGTLLYVETNYLWIRPASSAATNDWDSTSGNIVCNGHTDTQTSAATTGEMIWSNIYTLGPLQENTTIYVSQNNSVISNTESSGSGRWWGDGHLDILVLTTNQGNLIDRGLLSVYARQYSKKYSYYIVDASAGGRTPVPLSTSKDLNNTTGYRTFTGSSGSGTFNAGNGIYVGSTWATATKRGVLTAVGGTTSAPTLTYYLIGDLTDFASSDAVKEYVFSTSADGDATCTAATPSDTGPASQSLSITFGLDETLDINDDSTNEDYSIVIDLAGTISLADMNERLKYITRRGETSTLNGVEGQQYLGIDYRVDYNSLTGSIAEGSTVTQVLADATTATAEVVAHNTTEKYMMLRDTRGTLETGTGANNLQKDGSNYVTMTGSASTTVITPTLEHPFGSFAGGKFFGAQGVGLKNVPASDAQNYELIDNSGTRIIPPSTIALTVNSVASGDRVAMFRATGDNYTVDTNMYTGAATGNNSGDPDFVIQETIPNDTPDSGSFRIKTSSGEDRYLYSSWTGSTFTLDSTAHPTGLTSTYGADPVYVPYLDEEATGTSVSTSVTYVTNRYVVTRVRKKGIIPFKIKGQITSNGLTVTAIRTSDDIVS